MGRLFESFERLDEVKNRNIEGTGLGMSITTRLLSLMGSELEVASTYGEGSVFSFDLWQKIENPLPLGDFRPLPGKDADIEAYRESFRAFEAHILVVDDTRMNLMVVTNLLKKTEIQIDTAPGGEEAIELTGKNAYDVILLDQRMPKMDGVEVLQKIREQENGRNADTPVICLTADAINGARERYMGEGFTDYLTKPVDGQALENMLQRYLPKEKIISVLPELKIASEETRVAADPMLSALSEAGIDVEKGLSFCGNNRDIYQTVLREYLQSSGEKREKLQEYYDRRDWENYMILVHSLKSTSATIGAKELSGLSSILENAASQKNESIITRNHGDAMELYEKLSALLSGFPELVSEEEEEEEEEILEFPAGDVN
ncbi:MAG: response regulator, partial [Lachnospiraceae bacterium]|nr:response regulator [Lachnospiraceae bacterium]